MKRSKRKSKSPKQADRSTAPAASTPAPKAGMSRRDLIRNIQLGAVAAMVVGGGGWYLVQDVMASTREHDLSRIGNGIPTVVQIHDPGCPQCTALQRETRDALSSLEDGALQYVIADINRAEGRRFATMHRVNHVTLLLFDAKGERQGVLVGQNTADRLTEIFRNHIARHGDS